MTEQIKRPVSVAIVGNPNVGKSVLFNAITGASQTIGNWCGKTVAAAEGRYVWEGDTFRLVDLPGTYSLHPDSPEEVVTRDCLDGGADVIDAILGRAEDDLDFPLSGVFLDDAAFVPRQVCMMEGDGFPQAG